MKRNLIFKSLIHYAKPMGAFLVCLSLTNVCSALSLISYFYQTSYPNEECTPASLDPQTLKLTYSERSNMKNEFKVGWDLYTNKNLAFYQKPSIGGEVQIARCLPPGRWVYLGRGNVENVNGNTVEATIKGIDMIQGSSVKFPKKFIETGNFYWRPMAGDSVFPVEKSVSRKISISPKIEIAYEDIFVYLGSGEYSYDITPEGEEFLNNKFNHFKKINGRLEIDGFYIAAGKSEDLRLESLMRAQAVGNYFIRKFKLNPDQIVTIGYGNDWLQSGMQPVKAWPNRNLMRGIILKILPESADY
ncbi:OmpA family protein [Fluviispira sanaruensis]|uniref:OmpA-like domain-containing protein n=1 Tax=Fluviispira sanaruensis TaxID=2493639 RepID=A0A4P2VQ56_FLUSA|nr:OmpA family protein [Fluviispira sanaruensis]BBH54470.1 hypothetical protein JCM31447_29410 [Fluviispira sanaruensis]